MPPIPLRLAWTIMRMRDVRWYFYSNDVVASAPSRVDVPASVVPIPPPFVQPLPDRGIVFGCTTPSSCQHVAIGIPPPHIPGAIDQPDTVCYNQLMAWISKAWILNQSETSVFLLTWMVEFQHREALWCMHFPPSRTIISKLEGAIMTI